MTSIRLTRAIALSAWVLVSTWIVASPELAFSESWCDHGYKANGDHVSSTSCGRTAPRFQSGGNTFTNSFSNPDEAQIYTPCYILWTRTYYAVGPTLISSERRPTYPPDCASSQSSPYLGASDVRMGTNTQCLLGCWATSRHKFDYPQAGKYFDFYTSDTGTFSELACWSNPPTTNCGP